MTLTGELLHERLSERLSWVRNAIVTQIVENRSVVDLPDAFIRISDSSPSLDSSFDAADSAFSRGPQKHAVRKGLGFKRIARDLASVKVKVIGARRNGQSGKWASGDRDQATIGGELDRQWSTGSDRGNFELDLKRAIFIALRQSWNDR